MADDVAFMRRALELAAQGRTTVSPNPVVGCVVVADDTIIAEGFHERAGGPHAEIQALRMAGNRARGATAYVTLEPCSHTGRTGPCTDALIEAGIDVEVGLLEDEARRLNEIFFHGVATRRPFVVAKAAVSLDGRIAAADGTSQWLTGEEARERVHVLRAQVDAVLVGSGTVLADDPHLTCRLEGYEGHQPLRVVLDRRGRVRAHHRVCDIAAPTHVVKRYLDLHDILERLWQRDVRSVLVEGGASVLHSFLSANLVDRLHVHVAPVLLGERGRPLLAGPWAPTLAKAPRFALETVEKMGDDALLSLTPVRTAAGTLAATAFEEA